MCGIGEIDEATHLKFRVIIDTQAYWCMRDILLLEGMYSESSDLFKFGEIIDNILETGQDKDIFAMED